MLAYLFWHRPREVGQAAAYELALQAFHRSLQRSPPAGLIASACYRLPAALPWIAEPAYEDWYLLQDWGALGVLNEAAVGRGHGSAHEQAARAMADGAGGVFALLEGEAGALRLGTATVQVWVARPLGRSRRAPGEELAELLADGMRPGTGSVWRRQLVLGPAPELCVVGEQTPSGVRETRLPQGWHAQVIPRQVVFAADL